jgi:ATP-binding cassette, subfamily B, multidrug efflux pump
LRPYFRQLAGLLVVGSIAGIVMNVAVVLPAILLGRALDTALRASQHKASTVDVGVAALAFVAGTALTEVPRLGKRYWLGVARARFRANVRADALRGVLAWPPEQVALTPVGDVMARTIGDVEVLGQGVGEVIVEAWDTVLFSISLTVAMFVYDPSMAALALAPVPVALLLAARVGRAVARRTRRARESAAELTDALHEQLRGLRLLRLFGRASASTARIAELAQIQARAELEAIRLDEALGAVYLAIVSCGVVFIIWRGGDRVASGAMSVGALVAFLQLFVRFVTRAPRIPMMVNRLQAGGAAYRRLEPLLGPPPPAGQAPSWSSFRSVWVAEEPPRERPVADRASPNRSADVRFDAVTFRYPGAEAPALDRIDLDLDPGAFVAVTGPVGSGKSALAQLAAGLYRPAEGTVRVGGRVVADLSSEERARTVGYLSQEPHLFSGSIADNIALADATDQLSWTSPIGRGAALAALERDVEAMPHGLATQIGELGIRVSGGQRQRIALARALAASGQLPALLVLDDPFSAVGVDTETEIIAKLRETIGRTTVLLCSHRVAAFREADVIVVLAEGRIREQGRHEKLLAARGLYAQIHGAQALLVR